MQGSEPAPERSRGPAAYARRAGEAPLAPERMRGVHALLAADRVLAQSHEAIPRVIMIVSTDSLDIVVNGAARSFGSATTLRDVVAALGLEGKRIAVERNGEIVPRSRYAETPLANGDKLEI